MRYRPLDANGDATLGQPFFTNDPDAVAQAIQTRMALWQGQWFLDTTDGTPWLQDILGPRAGRNPEAAIKQRILGTPGVDAIASYSSNYDAAARTFTVSCLVHTQYSTTPIPVSTTLTPGT